MSDLGGSKGIITHIMLRYTAPMSPLPRRHLQRPQQVMAITQIMMVPVPLPVITCIANRGRNSSVVKAKVTTAVYRYARQSTKGTSMTSENSRS